MKFLTRIKKVSVFDGMVIFLAVVFVVFAGYVFFRKSHYVSAVIKVSEDDVSYYIQGSRTWFAQLFYVGMKQKDGLNRTMAEVTDIKSYDITPGKRALYLTVKLNTVYTRANKSYSFAGKPLVVGSPLKITFQDLLVEGLVTYVEGMPDPRVKQKLIVDASLREENIVYPETSGARIHVTNAINVGDEYKDNKGNVIIKVLEKRVEDAKRLVTTADGRTLVSTNPLRKDVSLVLEINAIKIGDRYYVFDDRPILIGENVPLNTQFLSVWPEITEINVAD